MHKEPRKVREFRRREQEILDTALKLFLDLGEDSVTVEMIADAVGIGKGTIYKHFKSKAEIYLRLMLDYERDLNELPLLPLIHASADRRDWRNWFAAFLDIPWQPQGGQLFDTLDLAMNAALQGFGLSLGDPTIVAEELESGALVAPFTPVLETDHEYALIARPDSQRHGVQRVCHWLLEGEGHP